MGTVELVAGHLLGFGTPRPLNLVGSAKISLSRSVILWRAQPIIDGMAEKGLGTKLIEQRLISVSTAVLSARVDVLFTSPHPCLAIA